MQEQTYRVFMIDLEAADLNKLNELKYNPRSLYYEGKRMPVLEYDSSMVNG